jgi:hypothetical protein
MKVPGPLIWKTGRQGVFVSDDPPSGSGPARRARGAPNGVAQRAYYVAKYVKLPTGGGVLPLPLMFARGPMHSVSPYH